MLHASVVNESVQIAMCQKCEQAIKSMAVIARLPMPIAHDCQKRRNITLQEIQCVNIANAMASVTLQ